MLNEGLTLAESFKSFETWPRARARLMNENISSLPKIASQMRVLREIYVRIANLTDKERLYMCKEADRPDQCALMWLAICRTYPFIREFAIEVINERFNDWRSHIGPEVFDCFFIEKIEFKNELAALSLSTRTKLRQVLFRMLREGGLLDDNGQIQPVWLSMHLKQLINEHNSEDIHIFPGN